MKLVTVVRGLGSLRKLRETRDRVQRPSLLNGLNASLRKSTFLLISYEWSSRYPHSYSSVSISRNLSLPPSNKTLTERRAAQGLRALFATYLLYREVSPILYSVSAYKSSKMLHQLQTNMNNSLTAFCAPATSTIYIIFLPVY